MKEAAASLNRAVRQHARVFSLHDRFGRARLVFVPGPNVTVETFMDHWRDDLARESTIIEWWHGLPWFSFTGRNA